MTEKPSLTGVERTFPASDIIVSKTDLKGRVTYANKVFLDIAGYTEAEVMGQPHSMIRHPDMPRCVFKLLWDRLQAGEEIFAYVVNRAKNGDHYWVLAHVTPSYDETGTVIGYHSNRRVPSPTIVQEIIVPTYGQLLEIEQQHANSKEGLAASFGALENLMKDKGVSYDQWVLSL